MRRALHLVLLAATLVIVATLVHSAQADPPQGRALAEPRGAAMVLPAAPLHAFLLDDWEATRPTALHLNGLLGNAPVLGPLSLSALGTPMPAVGPSATLIVFRDAIDVEASASLVTAALRTARSAADRAVSDALDTSGYWALPASITELRGRLATPVAGRVEVPFGPVRVPGLFTTVRHPGQTWRANSGADVATVARGIVRHAGELNGYGLVVIMDHGAGYYSVYAHLSRVDAEVGDLLEPQTTLGLVGPIETSTGVASGLYFELRRHDEALDPTDWLQPNR